MRTRDEVLREFSRPYQSHEDVGGPDADRMADRIRELKAQQAASEPVIPKWLRDEWRAERGSGMTSAVGEYTPREFWELLDAYESLLAHPSAAAVTVTEAMVERFSLAYRICEETHERTFTHNMGIKAGLTAALTAASEGASDV